MPDKHGYEWGTGRRKTAIARVRVKKGTGEFKINGRDYREYFPGNWMRHQIEGPMRELSCSREFDVAVNIRGGGLSGQAGAVMMGLGRALLKWFPDRGPELRAQGFLSRDSRMVERKKYGQHGARKSTQFSKR